MPAKKNNAKKSQLQISSNKNKKEDKTKNQKTDSTFSKKFIEIKNDLNSQKDLEILTKNKNQYISCLNINGFTKQFREPKDSKRIEIGQILQEENLLGLFLTAHNIKKWNHKMQFEKTKQIGSKKSIMKRRQGGILFYQKDQQKESFSEFSSNEIKKTHRKIFVKQKSKLTNETIILIGLQAPQNYHIDEGEIEGNQLIWWDDKKKKAIFDQNQDSENEFDHENDHENDSSSENLDDSQNLQKEQETFYTGLTEDLSYLKSQKQKQMLFGDFNMHFINEQEDQKNQRSEEVKNNKILKNFVKKGKLIVGNSFDSLVEDTCITSQNEYILADSIQNLPCTRYDGKGSGSTIDYIMWHKDIKNIEKILITGKNHVCGTDHVLLRAYFNEKTKKDEIKWRPQINIKKLKNKKFKKRQISTLRMLLNKEKRENGQINTFSVLQDIIQKAGKSSLGLSKQKSDFQVENKEIKKIRIMLNKYKRQNDISKIKIFKELLGEAVFKEREKVRNVKKEKLAKSYPKDPSTYQKEIRRSTTKFQNKKPKIEKNVMDTSKKFFEWWSKQLTLENFENNDQIYRFKIFEKFVTIKQGAFGHTKILEKYGFIRKKNKKWDEIFERKIILNIHKEKNDDFNFYWNAKNYDLEEFEKFFKNEISINDLKVQNQNVYTYKNHNEQLQILDLSKDFTEEEILNAIQKLSINKANGPDLIKNELLKEAKIFLAPVLKNVFNKYLKTGSVDESLLEGRISMLYKKGDVFDPQNQRPINLLNGIQKILQFCIKNRLQNILYDKISETQFAYMPKRSGEDINVLFRHLIEQNTTGNNKDFQLLCTRFDIKKAFDSLIHTILINKQLEQGIDNKLLYLIMDLKIRATQTIDINGQDTEKFQQSKGNRQGGVYEPTEWIFFQDFILKFLNEKGNTNEKAFKGPEVFPGKNINNICQADDLMTMILTDDYISKSQIDYQRNLDFIKEKFSENQLDVNITKTGRTYHPQKKQKKKKEQNVFWGQNVKENIIDYEWMYTHNGVRQKIDSHGKLSFQDQCEHIVNKLSQILEKLKRLKFYNTSLCAIGKFRVWNSWADSVLKYSCCSQRFEDEQKKYLHKIEKIYTQAQKVILDCPISTATNVIREELYTISLVDKLYLRRCMYLLKNLNHDKLTGQIIKKAISEEIDFYLQKWVKIDSTKQGIDFKDLILKLEKDYTNENLNKIFKSEIKHKVYFYRSQCRKYGIFKGTRLNPLWDYKIEMHIDTLNQNISNFEKNIDFSKSLHDQINYSTGEFAIRFSCHKSVIPRQQLSLNCILTEQDRIQNKLKLMKLPCNRRIATMFRDQQTKKCPVCQAELDDEKHLLFECIDRRNLKNYLKNYLDDFSINKIYNYDDYELNIILNDRYLYIRNKCLNSKKLKIFDKAIKNFIFEKQTYRMESLKNIKIFNRVDIKPGMFDAVKKLNSKYFKSLYE